MGRLIDGKWRVEDSKTDEKGNFVREQTAFRGHVTADGSSGFKAEAGRYHLYASLACPWAHRTLIMRELKRLTGIVSLSIVDPVMGPDGWGFSRADGPFPDHVNHSDFLRQIYVTANPTYTGRVAVPVLWDKRESTIVSNESREILRMLDCEFDEWADASRTFCPSELRAQIDETIDALYAPFNNGVYRTGFATTQHAYETALDELFQALEGYDDLLSRRRYLCGSTPTEADICFYTTLVRFDAVYHYHFKCNLKKIGDFAQLSNYLRDLFQIPEYRKTTAFDHIKRHYYMSHDSINPRRIVAKGPLFDLNQPHDRARFEPA